MQIEMSQNIPITQASMDSGESDSEPPSFIGETVDYGTREGCDILVAPAFPPSHLNSQFVLACSCPLQSTLCCSETSPHKANRSTIYFFRVCSYMLFFQSVFSFLSFLEKFLSICIQN
jgi:hypothetical protein